MSGGVLTQLAAGVTTSGPAGTEAWAERLAKLLPPEATLALHGDLGAGKTTFVKGLARPFGVAETVTSPTFNLLSIYRGSGPGARTLLHLDAYRLGGDDDYDDLMVDEFLTPPYCLAVEWPGRVAGRLPPNAWHLYLEILAGDVHQLQLRREGEGGWECE